MNTETLIHSLSLECQTVRPIEHPTTRLFKWFIAAVFLVAAGVWLLQPQLHVGSRLYDPLFIFPAIAMVCISFICAMSAFLLTVPAERIRRFKLISIASVAFAFGSLVYL